MGGLEANLGGGGSGGGFPGGAAPAQLLNWVYLTLADHHNQQAAAAAAAAAGGTSQPNPPLDSTQVSRSTLSSALVPNAGHFPSIRRAIFG